MAKVKTQCSSCFIGVVVDTEEFTLTAKIPSNGLRGAKYVAPHTVTEEIASDGHGLLLWECPGCGYADSTYESAKARRELS